jgi:hypothetical protein
MKTYTFKFSTRPCTFENGFISVKFEMFKDTEDNKEVKTMTWKDAQVYFLDYFDRQVGPVACYINIVGATRKPAGWKDFPDELYKRG